MAYRYSQIDKKNIEWFQNDKSKATLLGMRLIVGSLRGLYPFDLEFNYPITVVAGRNGSGKSTVLSMAACAFHNKRKGFKLANRKYPYYTFSDFFIQSSDEVSPDGILISYAILWDKWQPNKKMPTGVGVGRQVRKKNKGGKWNNYAGRADRDVVFFGIERVVPHSEKSVSKSYRNYFIEDEEEGFEVDVRNAVGRVLRKSYDRFWFAKHSKYRLPHVEYHGVVYSGFNMGAGENALFEIFSTIFASPPGLLLVIDEIELGLHEDAQKRLIKELKRICKERHIQIIATTHSPAILKALPPEARFYLDAKKNETCLYNGISPAYAAGLLASENSNELDIYVEDNISEYIVHAILDGEDRKRINIIPIGSSMAIVRQLAANFKNPKESECLSILDGDQSKKLSKLESNFIKAIENSKEDGIASKWFNERIKFLPGNTWPERWLFEKMIEAETESLSKELKVDDSLFKNCLEESLSEGKHKEIYSLSDNICVKSENLCYVITQWAANSLKDDFTSLQEDIKLFLK